MRCVLVLAIALLLSSCTQTVPSGPREFERWLAADSSRAPAFARFEAFLAREGVADVVEARELWMADRMRPECVVEPFVMPPEETWLHIVPALRYIRDHACDGINMKDVLRAAGVPVARHRLLGTHEDAETFVREVGFPIVVKPPAGAGARATHRLNDAHELSRMLQQYPPRVDDPMLAEEFLRGTEHSLETVSIGGRAVWHSLTHYYPTPLTVVENPWIQWGVVLPREVDAPAYDDIRTIGARALDALGMDTGVSHCEWFRRADGSVAISEIAARPPGAQITTMISRAHDVAFVRAWAILMIHGTFERPVRRYAVGTAYLRGQGHGRVESVHGLDALPTDVRQLVCDLRLPERGQVPTGSYEGEGFIMIRHPDTTVVERALQRIISTVRVTLA